MSSLDLDTIKKLLQDETAQRTVTHKTGPDKNRPRPAQLGPLGWGEQTERCASRGCSSPTFIRVEGVPRCSSHALYALNYILIQTHSDYEEVSFTQNDCTCNAGKHSMMNIHGFDCAIYEKIKEHSVSNKSSYNTNSDSDDYTEYPGQL